MVNEQQKPTIMVVDDTPANLRLLQKMLGDYGYRVTVFPLGRLALEAVVLDPPDLILLDINMPEMNGYEVCKILKTDEKLREIPVIFISALNEIADKVQAFAVGGVDYVTKPFQFDEVKARVTTHLKLRGALRELRKQNQILQENMRLREFVDQITKHDLKNPLNAFFNVPELVLEMGGLSKDQIELLNLLPQSAQKMLEMIHSSLDLYKMERGSYQLTPVPVNVLKIVRDVFQSLANPIKAKDLSYVVLLDQKPAGDNDIFELPGEALLFFSLLSNLVKNAVEASPNGKEVKVTLISSPRGAISINNQGVIPPQIRDRFFERYATFGKARGSGLGAFSANLMARTLGGELSFTSNETDGTTLVMTMNPGT